MAVQGKLEVTIKINELPVIAFKDKNGSGLKNCEKLS